MPVSKKRKNAKKSKPLHARRFGARRVKSLDQYEQCPCGSTLAPSQCCGQYIVDRLDPPTPEACMRSRYTAFVVGDDDYLRYSWDPETCPEGSLSDASIEWKGLKVTDATEQPPVVSFVASMKDTRGLSPVVPYRETSLFRRHEGRWVYVEALAT